MLGRVTMLGHVTTLDLVQLLLRRQAADGQVRLHAVAGGSTSQQHHHHSYKLS